MRQQAAARGQGGFTYLGLVILLAILGLVAAAGIKMGSLMQRAAAEEELLEIGAQFSEALRSYAAATPQGKPQQPPALQDLLKDPRFPNPRRHLRKIFVDPMTGKAEWGIVWLGDKAGVLGVYSLSEAKPLKVANFDIRFQNMENKEKISDWKFGMAGGQGLQPAAAAAANSMTGSGPGAPPSLFAPGAGGDSSGLKGGKPGDAPAPGGKPGDALAPGGKPGGAPVAEAKPAEPPPQDDVPADEGTSDEVKPEETDKPAEASPDEDKQAEEAARKEAEEEERASREAAGSGAQNSTLPPPNVPPPEGGRRRR